jgi:flavin reductase (DIM6/NTAB) family NADH-FMN oxidoreductase RutF
MSDERITQALEKISYGVSVVTVGRGSAENGLTVSWLSQVSFEPPMVMVAIAKLHYSEEFLRSTKNFVVNILGEDQGKIAAAFARESMAGDDKLKKVPTKTADNGAAILSDAVAYIECEAAQFHTAGDHLLVIGKVEGGGVLHDARPLTSESGIRYRQSKPRK